MPDEHPLIEELNWESACGDPDCRTCDRHQQALAAVRALLAEHEAVEWLGDEDVTMWTVSKKHEASREALKPWGEK